MKYKDKICFSKAYLDYIIAFDEAVTIDIRKNDVFISFTNRIKKRNFILNSDYFIFKDTYFYD
jgi:hypothetical protein